MDKLPQTIFLKLTSKCNHNCKYCYDSKKHPDMTLFQLKKLFGLFHRGSVKAIVLSGGEPLIRTDIPEIFKAIKDLDMQIYLDTNGDLFFKYKEAIDKYVDILGLPIDYASEKKFFRTPENFKNILKILEYYSKIKNRPIIRIGTVVTKENINHLKEIGDLLKNYPIGSWKIYQFIPIGPNAFANRSSLNINTEEFIKKTAAIEREYSKYFKITISKRESRNKAYFFVSSDGTVFMPMDDEINHGDMEIGNIFDTDIIQKWLKVVDMNNYNENVRRTFNYNKI